MALVQSSFTALILMYSSNFGIKCTKEELEDYVFFWRGIGYLLGIKDEFNICSGNYDETYRVCKEIGYEIVYRSLLKPAPKYETLSTACINGVNLIHKFQMFTRESIIAFGLRFTGLSIPSFTLSWTDELRVWCFKCTIFLIRYMPGFERLTNYMVMRLYRRILSTRYKELSSENATF